MFDVGTATIVVLLVVAVRKVTKAISANDGGGSTTSMLAMTNERVSGVVMMDRYQMLHMLNQSSFCNPLRSLLIQTQRQQPCVVHVCLHACNQLLHGLSRMRAAESFATLRR